LGGGGRGGVATAAEGGGGAGGGADAAGGGGRRHGRRFIAGDGGGGAVSRLGFVSYRGDDTGDLLWGIEDVRWAHRLGRGRRLGGGWGRSGGGQVA
jgi:hypothetical protein